MTGRRDVEDFESLLWQWFDAERSYRETREGNYPDWEAEGTKKAKAAADKTFEAVRAAFLAEPAAVAAPTPSTLPPPNSRDSDFP